MAGSHDEGRHVLVAGELGRGDRRRARRRLDRRDGLRGGGGGDHLRRRRLHGPGLGAEPVARSVRRRRGAASAGERKRARPSPAAARRRRWRLPVAAPVRRPWCRASRRRRQPGAGGGAISERVRDAARAAGEAARAALGDVAPAARRVAGAAGGVGGAARGRAGRSEADQGGRAEARGAAARELGIYHFRQIAAWGPGEIAWIESNLEGFSGRVIRDDWVGQAKVLAAGGETEHLAAGRPGRSLT